MTATEIELLTTPTMDLSRAIYRCGRLVRTAAARELDSRGESLLAWQVVARLARGGPATQRQLADSAGQHPAGISRLLTELERRGLVRRRRDPRDRRKMTVQATPAGKAMFLEHLPAVADAAARIFEPLDAEERRRLLRLLDKVLRQGR